MKIAYYIKKKELAGDERIASFLSSVESSGIETYDIRRGLEDGTDMLVSFGGDGTFLTASRFVFGTGVPILGVNLGRMGFLSDAEVGEALQALLSGSWSVEQRSMLMVRSDVEIPDLYPYVLNEVALRRSGSGTLGIDVRVDSSELPTYWADGLLVSTSSGSTAYSLSAGGPLCMPDVRAFIIAPIAPHNLNMRPLVVPQSSTVVLSPADRKNRPSVLSLDNRDYMVPAGAVICVSEAPATLGRVVTGKSNFIGALRSKLFWGEDVRNTH